MIFGLIVASLWLFATVYSFGYMDKKPRLGTYYAFFLLSLSVTLSVAFSGNLLALYLFYELLTLVTYPLVIQTREEATKPAGRKYILYSLSGAALILLAIVLTYSRGGQMDFSTGPLLAGAAPAGLGWVLGLFILGFGVKAALMPLHRWLPEAMVAPTPVSALLHAVAVVYSGVFGILRTVYSIFGIELMQELRLARLLPWLAVFTIITGVIIATRQDVLKKRLAYHTISQLSYILLGAFTLQPWGLAGSLLHMISYSTLKITLFFCAGIISEQTGETDISRMEGIGWQLPRTMLAFGVASLGMIGMLPLNTFWSKYYLMQGGIKSGGWIFALALIISGIINAVCFIPTVVAAFKGNKTPSVEKGRKVYLMLGPTLLLATAAVLLGLFPGLVWPGIEKVLLQIFAKVV
jgi:multicomponent Na+:H+ antiporter subunit D